MVCVMIVNEKKKTKKSKGKQPKNDQNNNCTHKKNKNLVTLNLGKELVLGVPEG